MGRKFMRIELFTAAYPKFNPDAGVPVRTSNGTPKFALRYPLTEVAPLVIPQWALVRSPMSDAEFDVAYMADLDQIGVEAFRGQFEKIAARAGDGRLVLLCFEASRSKCHRGAFARWWEERTGEVVRELPVVADAPVPQPSLF